MIGPFDSQTVTTALHIALGLGAGAVLGVVHFGTLKWNTELYLGRSTALGPGLQILRFAVLVAVFFALAKLGAGALLSGALGLLVIRRLFLSRARNLP